MKYRSKLLWILTMIVIVGIANADVFYDFGGGGPGFTVNGSAVVANGYMQLTQNAGSLQGSVIFDPISTAPIEDFEVSFDFTTFQAGADGMSFALIDPSIYDLAATFGEAGPGNGSLSVGIDLYDNGGEAQAGGNYLDIRLNGAIIASAIPSFTMEATGWHHVEIVFVDKKLTLEITPEGGDPEVLFDQVPVDGYVPFAGRFGFGARTGGVWMEQAIDNVRLDPGWVWDRDPAPSATDVPVGVYPLSWKPAPPEGQTIRDYKVYFSDNRFDIDPNNPDVETYLLGTVTETMIDSPSLEDTKTYYWRVMSFIDDANYHNGGITSFTTEYWGPVITDQPDHVVYGPACTPALSLTAASAVEGQGGDLHYQWYRVVGTVGGGDDEAVGTDSDTLLTDVEGRYYAVVSNDSGSTTSNTVSVTFMDTKKSALAEGLVGYWPFDDNADDISGNGYHATMAGQATLSPGLFGNAWEGDDGNNDYAETGMVASELGIGGNSPRTVSVWCYARDFDNGGLFDCGNRVTGENFSLRTLDAITHRWRIQYWGGDYDFETHTGLSGPDGALSGPYFDPFPSANTWVHFVHVHDGVYTKIYANGTLIVDWAKTINTTDARTFRIGYYADDNTFNGYIDDFALWSRALTADEAAQLYAAGKAGLALQDIGWAVTEVSVSPMDENNWVDYDSDATISWQRGALTPCDADFLVYATQDESVLTDPNAVDRLGLTPIVTDQMSVVLADSAYGFEHDQTWYYRIDVASEAGADTEIGTWRSFSTVKWVPEVAVNPAPQNVVPTGGDVTLTYQVTTVNDDVADLESVTWKRVVGEKDGAADGDDDIISQQAPVFLGVNGKKNWDCSVILTIAGVGDEGVYYCVAENSSGAAVSSDAIVLTERLMLWYEFEAINGGMVADSSATDADGTLKSPLAWADQPITGGIVPGVIGNAIDLVGNTDPNAAYVDSGMKALDLGIMGARPRSVSVWARSQDMARSGVYGIGEFGTSMAVFGVHNRNQPGEDYVYQFDHWGANFNYADWDAIGAWVHIVHVYDGQNVKIYVDGTKVADYAASLNTSSSAAALPMVVGFWADYDASYQHGVFDGQIDEFRLYNYALSPQEIGQLYIAGVGGSVCVEMPAYDLTGDCKVDLEDFAMFAASWAESTLVSP